MWPIQALKTWLNPFLHQTSNWNLMSWYHQKLQNTKPWHWASSPPKFNLNRFYTSFVDNCNPGHLTKPHTSQTHPLDLNALEFQNHTRPKLWFWTNHQVLPIIIQTWFIYHTWAIQNAIMSQNLANNNLTPRVTFAWNENFDSFWNACIGMCLLGL